MDKSNVTDHKNFCIKHMCARNTKSGFGNQSLYNYLRLEQPGEMHCQFSHGSFLVFGSDVEKGTQHFKFSILS